ncbi:MAG: ribonuclease III [Candidatus Neomarinimicrobiota bacterium]
MTFTLLNFFHKTRSPLENKLGYAFKNPELLRMAVTHRSKAAKSHLSYERLEFLGDAILEMIVSEYLYKKYPEKLEGDLTLSRSVIVNGDSLFEVGKKLNLQENFLLDKSLNIQNVPTMKKIYSSVVESLLGAIYIDGGLKAVYPFVNKWILLDGKREIATARYNYKGQVFEICQKQGKELPRFTLEEMTGPDHAHLYKIAVIVDGKKLGFGVGHTKRAAEQKAAKEAYFKLTAYRKKQAV